MSDPDLCQVFDHQDGHIDMGTEEQAELRRRMVAMANAGRRGILADCGRMITKHGETGVHAAVTELIREAGVAGDREALSHLRRVERQLRHAGCSSCHEQHQEVLL